MSFDQSFSQNQKQAQQLKMTQQLQQSLQMLHMNQEDLLLFLKQKALGNPLIEVKASRSAREYSYKAPLNYDPLSQVGNGQKSLFALVIEQVYLTLRDTPLRKLVLWLIHYIDENGYLTITLKDAATLTNADPVALLDALILLQQLEPAGLGARNLQECLMLQTERDNTAPSLTYLILEESFDLISSRKWTVLADKYSISLTEVQEIIDYLQTLSAHPGAIYAKEEDFFIYPDIIVQRKEDYLTVVTAKTGLPIVTFQEEYYQDMLAVDDEDVKKFIRDKYTEYNWIKNSLLQREETIVRVGTAIVDRQKEFFLNEHHPLTPMTMKEVALLLDVHESTVSRTVHDKYLQTDFGTFELRSFFTAALSRSSEKNSNESDISSHEVKQNIKHLIAGEHKLKPLSDQKIAEKLEQDGIQISRRTVAKYREEMSIPSSPNRKRLAD